MPEKEQNEQKEPFLPRQVESPPAANAARPRLRALRCGWLGRVVAAIAIIFGAFVVLGLLTPHISPKQASSKHGGPVLLTNPALEAHIMSKCPDAKDCLANLVLPVMEKMADKVDFTLSYIGTESENWEQVECMHGPDECVGNVLELCAAHLYPDPKIYLGFTMCLTNDYQHIPQRGLVEGCALEHQVDFDLLNDCASKDDGAFGLGLLRESVQRTQGANVTKSCTIRLNKEVWCVRDGGKWTDCQGGHKPKDLIRDIKELAS